MKAKKEIVNENYEKLVDDLNEARSNAIISLLIMCNVVLEANKSLSKTQWNKWLRDKRIKIKNNQAEKYIIIANYCKNNIQLTGLLKKCGLEKTYEVCRIKDEKNRNSLAEQIIDVPFNVKQVRKVVEIVDKQNKTTQEAIEEVKNLPKIQQPKPVIEMIPKIQFDELKTDYEKLLKQKTELEKKLSKFEHLSPKIDTKDTIQNTKELQTKLIF